MTTAATSPITAFDVHATRRDFPILSRTVHGKPLVYLDNAATSQKPASVIETVRDYYQRYNSNVHRGLHDLSAQATDAYEGARNKVRDFLNAAEREEIVFTRGATEAINLVTASYGRTHLNAGDRVLITAMEHHSNIVPWQVVAEERGATVDAAPFDDRGVLDMAAFEKLLERGPKIVAFVWISNSLGTINPVKAMIEKAKAAGATTLVDACQAAPHARIDVRDLGCDFLAISGHKMFGPTGIGALYGRRELLEAMPPYQTGGDTIEQVKLDRTTFLGPPQRFEAGTPNIAGAIGLAAAIEYMERLDWDGATAHERDLLAYGTERLSAVEGVRLIGTSPEKTSILSFVVEGAHAYDIAPVLDRRGVAVRTGHHCCQPVMDHYGVPATVRASLAFYNTRDEIDTLVEALEKAKAFFL